MLDTVPPPLLDRMELIFLQGYSEEEKVHIAFRYLIPRQIKENGITPEQIEFPEDAVRYIVRHYTREAGVRKLEQAWARFAASRRGAWSRARRKSWS
jgi:ATP-dependent Lon protease